MTQMKWHAEIKHMADHGFESVERPPYLKGGKFVCGDDTVNPVTYPDVEWRIKPTKLKISVEIPKPAKAGDDSGYWLDIGKTGIRFSSQSDRDEAERILVAALRVEYLATGASPALVPMTGAEINHALDKAHREAVKAGGNKWRHGWRDLE